VALEDGDGGGTVLAYDLDAQVGGRIAGVGQRLLDSSAKVVTRQALEGLEAQIAARAGAVQAGEAASGTAREGSAVPTVAPAVPSRTLFAARFARGLFEELVPAPWRPVVVGGGVLLLLAVVFLLVRACSG
jgi:hypothetical protein